MTLLALTLVPEAVPHAALFVVLGSLAALLVSAAKGGFGGSVGLLSMPMMVYACGGTANSGSGELAAGIMLPLLIACDQVSLASWWGRWNWRPVLLMLPGVLIGIAMGGGAFAALLRMGASGRAATANALLMLGIGLIALGFVAIQVVRLLRGRAPAFRPVLWQGTCFGAAAGFTSTLAHAAGPITAMYLLPQQMPKERYVATTTLYYWMGNLLKLAVYVPLGLLNHQAMAATVVFLPAVVIGTLSGVFLHRRIGQRSFDIAVYGLLLLAGAKLLWDAAGNLT